MKDKDCWKDPDNCFCDVGELKPVEEIFTSIANAPYAEEMRAWLTSDRKTLIQEIVEMLEGMKKPLIRGLAFREQNINAAGYNQALQDAITRIKQMDV